MSIQGRFLLISDNFKVYGSHNRIIPAKIGIRKGHSNQIVILFDKELNVKNELDALIVDFDNKLIGKPERGRKAFISFFNIFIYQKTKKADYFIPINGLPGDPVYITYINFNGTALQFNSYDNLRQFGDTIFVRQLDK